LHLPFECFAFAPSNALHLIIFLNVFNSSLKLIEMTVRVEEYVECWLVYVVNCAKFVLRKSCACDLAFYSVCLTLHVCS